jgi:hypothetical protein
LEDSLGYIVKTCLQKVKLGYMYNFSGRDEERDSNLEKKRRENRMEIEF